MIINNNNCTITNSQIGDNNTMTNTLEEVDWNKWYLFCQELKSIIKSTDEEKMIIKLEKEIEKQNKSGLKKLVKDNKSFFSDIISGFFSSIFSDLVKNLLFS